MLENCSSGVAGESAADVAEIPKNGSLRSQYFDGQRSCATQSAIAVKPTLAEDADTLGLLRPKTDSSLRKRGRASRATPVMAPIEAAPDSLKKSGGDVGKDEAKMRPKPEVSVPRPSKFGGNADARHAGDRSTSNKTLPAAQLQSAGDGGNRVDQLNNGTHPGVVDPVLIEEIKLQWRMRQLWLSAEVKLTLQAKAFCRALAVNGDKKEADAIYKAALGTGEHPRAALAMAAMLPLLESRDSIEKRRGEIEKHLDRLAKRLPVVSFVKETHGASLRGLAAIVGEAGDIAAYSNPGKLWKRMGLAPHAGKAYSTWRGDGGLTSQDWIDAGYAPKRRSAMFVIGGSLIGGMGKGKRPLVGQNLAEVDWRPLEKLFVERLRHEAERDPENMARPATAEGKESFSRWAAARAQRYVEKRFLRDLWRAWRGEAATFGELTRSCLPPLPQLAEAA